LSSRDGHLFRRTRKSKAEKNGKGTDKQTDGTARMQQNKRLHSVVLWQEKHGVKERGGRKAESVRS